MRAGSHAAPAVAHVCFWQPKVEVSLLALFGRNADGQPFSGTWPFG